MHFRVVRSISFERCGFLNMHMLWSPVGKPQESRLPAVALCGSLVPHMMVIPGHHQSFRVSHAKCLMMTNQGPCSLVNIDFRINQIRVWLSPLLRMLCQSPPPTCSRAAFEANQMDGIKGYFNEMSRIKCVHYVYFLNCHFCLSLSSPVDWIHFI